MGYSISYGDEIVRKKIPDRRIGKSVWIGLLSIAVCGSLIGIWGRKAESKWIPGDDELTSAAFGQLVTDMRYGDSAYDAFENFCRVIIQDDIPEDLH